ncbi:MAG: leucine-rich repeat protein [Oscillospiraceae bacterium]|nr:leucine-rich repeat protein [Oscillospiraceae bacterium]
MKTYLKKVAVFSALACMLSLQAIPAGAYWEDNIYYEIWGDEAVVSRFRETERKPMVDLVIPSELGGYPVTFLNGVSIGKMPNLVSVSIPDTVTRIGTDVFYECPKLETVHIPDSVTTIQGGAFRDCPNLLELDIPASVTQIGACAFENTGWMNARLEESPLVTVNHILINGRTCTENPVLSEDIHIISQNAFAGNQEITSVEFSNQVTEIKRHAFEQCSNLKEIVLPESVTSIEYDAFRECTNLESITIENPYCRIEHYNYYYDGFVISNGYDIYDDGSNLEMLHNIPYYHGVIRGYENSTAQAYAEQCGYQFESIGIALKAGDADSSGEVDILDIISLNKAVMGTETLTPEQLRAIDFNNNGKPDADEALTLLKYVVGLISSPV